MTLIFIGSTNTLSGQNTSRFLGPFLRWLVPDITPAALEQAQLIVRKCGHITEYAILAGLSWFALRGPAWKDPRPWTWREAGLALAVAVLYAASDEVHQSLVPTRFGSPMDVLIDSCGAAAGLALLWAFVKWRRAGVK